MTANAPNASFHFSCLRVSGKDAANFLAGQFTCHTSFPDNQWRLAAYSNIKGRITAVFFLLARDNHFYCILPTASLSFLEKKLRFYARFSQITLSSFPLGVAWTSAPMHSVDSAAWQAGLVEWHQPDGFACTLCLPDGRIMQAEQASLPKLHDAAAWLFYDAQAKLPWLIDAAQSEAYLAHHLSLVEKKAIAFDKGCYLGQEIIARMEHKSSDKAKASRLFCSQSADEKSIVLYQGLSKKDYTGEQSLIYLLYAH